MEGWRLPGYWEPKGRRGRGQLGVSSQQQFTEVRGLFLKAKGWETRVGGGDFSYVNVLFKCILALGRLSPFRNWWLAEELIHK